MAINLATGFNRTTGEPIDVLYLATGLVSYASVLAANTAIISTVRYVGQFVNVGNELYWYKNGITDPDLIAFTSGGGGGIAFTSLTYAALQTLIGASGLVQGDYYLINDYETIYDQPDYDNAGNPKPSVTTNTGTVEPLIVQASSVNEINERAISTLYPLDVIQYDVTFKDTEVMTAPAKGRIILRTDNNNNTTNYDHRQVVFKRYETTPASGIYTVIYDNGNPSLDTIPTFGADCYSNKIGNFYTTLDLNNTGFILSNNIFGDSCHDNKTGSDFYNNTFGGNIYSNIFGDLCHDNVIIGDAHENIINNNFFLNTLTTRFWNNIVGDKFNNNITSIFFTNNEIQTNFQYNILGNNFQSNKIGNYFASNQIGNYFTSNKIGDSFSINQIGDNFGYNTNIPDGNQIGDNFKFNFVGNDFYSNVIENDCVGNVFRCIVTINYTLSSSNFTAGETIYNGTSVARIRTDNGTNSMTAYLFSGVFAVGDTIDNSLSGGTATATIDSILVTTFGIANFHNNILSSSFGANVIGSNFAGNNFGFSFGTNILGDDAINNIFGSNCQENEIRNNFQYNNIGSSFNINIINDYFSQNTIKSNFTNNDITDYFEHNQIGTNFTVNNIGDNFSSNFILDYFTNNAIARDFQNNNICSNFSANTDIGNNFQFNIFQSPTSSTSYLTATHVYTTYTCIIFTNAAATPTQRLSYYDAVDVLTITAPNS